MTLITPLSAKPPSWSGWPRARCRHHEVVAADPDGTACDVPALLLTRLPGRPPAPTLADQRGFLTQLAEVLAAIHALNGHARECVPAYRTYVGLDGLTMPAWVPPTPTWQRAFALAAGPAPQTRDCFIHRDYHHGNTLWSRGRLTGVVDWNQASWGPGPVDLGHMRWNLSVGYGIQAAEDFLASTGPSRPAQSSIIPGKGPQPDPHRWLPQRSSGAMAAANRSLSPMTVAPILTGRGGVGPQVMLRSNSRKKS